MLIEKFLYEYGKYILIGIIIIVVAFFVMKDIAKPSIDESRVSAIISLKNIGEAMKAWAMSQVPPTYIGTSLSELGVKYPNTIDEELATGIKDGYVFMLLPLSDYEYFCLAIPKSGNKTGSKSYRITESGIVEEEALEGWIPVQIP